MSKNETKVTKEHINKVKILKNCSAYISLGNLRKFKKGEICEVNDYIFESFTKKLIRAEAFKEEIEIENLEEEIEEEEIEIENLEEENKLKEIEDLKKENIKVNEIIKEYEELFKEKKEIIKSLKEKIKNLNKKKEDNKEEDEDIKEKLNQMNKVELKKYAKENYNISISGNIKKMIKKILEVENV